MLGPSLPSLKSEELPYMPGEILVKFKPNASARAIGAIHASRSASIMQNVADNIQRVRIKSGTAVQDAIRDYSSDPAVEEAQPNFIYYPFSVPNDTYFDQLWALHNTGQIVNGAAGTTDADIDAPQAWDITTGTGASIIVAVIDSGVFLTHSDLSNNVLSASGWDFFDNDSDPTDYDGHGTQVSGLIGAVGGNNAGIIGVNPNAKIMPLRSLGVSVFTKPYGLTSTVVPAIDFARTHGARIINASLGGPNYDSLMYDAIKKSSEAGILFVASAGNEGTNNAQSHHYPSDYDLSNIISVAATDQNDNLASFSNYGSTTIHVAAPGENIYSSIPIFLFNPYSDLYIKDFDSDTAGQLPSGWVSTGTNNRWTVSNATSTSGTLSLEDSTGTNYENNTDSLIYYATPVTYSKDSRLHLFFQVQYAFADSNDYLNIMFSTNTMDWHVRGSSITGNSKGAFIFWDYDLTPIGEMFTDFYFGFKVKTASTDTANGVALDDVSLTKETFGTASSNYDFADGTSFAAPIVSGIASLILSYNHTLTVAEVKDIILNGVDKKDNLSNKVITGGRVNAYNSLRLTPALPPPPLPPAPPLPPFVADVDRGNVQIRTGEQGYLNPRTGGEAAIAFKPQSSGTVSIKLYTLSGQLVWETSKAVSENSTEAAYWNGRNSDGSMVSSGIYLIHIKGAGLDIKKKIAVMK